MHLLQKINLLGKRIGKPIGNTIKVFYFFAMGMLLSFTPLSDGQSKLLYKCEKGMVSLKKDFVVVDFDLDYYYRGEGSYVEILILKNSKKYLGYTDEAEYRTNKSSLIKKYQKEVEKEFDEYDSSNKKLRVEKRNGKVHFFYYDQLAEITFGDRKSNGVICVGGHKGEYQVLEKNIIITVYMDNKFVFGEKIARDSNYNVVEQKNFSSEHFKTGI